MVAMARTRFAARHDAIFLSVSQFVCHAFEWLSLWKRLRYWLRPADAKTGVLDTCAP